MKNIIPCLAIATIAFTACNSGNNKSTTSENTGNDTAIAKMPTADTATANLPAADAKNIVPVKEILTAYLQLKNAFTNDNSNDAAASAVILQTGLKNFNKAALSAQQKKTFEDIADDAGEHAEHIGKNAGNIEHQREHFEMLSKDMYDLVNAFGSGQVLYKDFCPMYNKGKGAFWLSETKEIKNPYLGKAMPTCGTVKEEIK